MFKQVIMDKPKRESPLSHHKSQTKLCLNCGFPNLESDKRCMYCKASIKDETGLISWVQQTYYILRWRWQLNQKYEKFDVTSRSTLAHLKLLGFFLIGVVLGSMGIYLFARSVVESSFSNGLIAVLLLFYGAFTLRSLFLKK